MAIIYLVTGTIPESDNAPAAVTVRDRDTMDQDRPPIADLVDHSVGAAADLISTARFSRFAP